MDNSTSSRDFLSYKKRTRIEPAEILETESAFRGKNSAFRKLNSAFLLAKCGILSQSVATCFLFLEGQMRNLVGKEVEVLADKRGIPVYMSNPSVPPAAEIKKTKRTQLGDNMKGLVLDTGSGEILGHGGAIAYEWEEVDKERFVKLYLAGLKQAAGLSKAGLAMFEFVYRQLQERPGEDVIPLALLTSGMRKTTYYEGLRELLEKEFLFRSPNPGLFFVNIRFMFNGDRLAFVKGYRLKDTSKQGELPLEEPAALPTPETAI
jgi:hypothetical protein